MGPAEVIAVVNILVKYGPGVAQQIVELFKKNDVKPEDWDSVFTLINKDFDSYFKKPNVKE